jgi:hypothetical protein
MREEVEWTGGSGRTYTFVVVPWPAPIDFGVVDGNYICARQTKNGEWIPIYIGEGDLAAPGAHSHPSYDLLIERDVTHFHCHINNDPAARRREAQDLLAGQTLAFVPGGCNEPVPDDEPELCLVGARTRPHGVRYQVTQRLRRVK